MILFEAQRKNSPRIVVRECSEGECISITISNPQLKPVPGTRRVGWRPKSRANMILPELAVYELTDTLDRWLAKREGLRTHSGEPTE